MVAVAAPVLNVAIDTPCKVVPASSDLAPWAVMFPVTALTPAPPTSCRRKSTLGISTPRAVLSPELGSASRTSRSSTRCCRVLCTSTTGDSPVTVMVSSIPPTRRSALMRAVKLPDSSTPSRCTTAKPGNVNVTVYSPGRRFSIAYCPVPSVTAVRTFSISAALAASTVTPGSTEPDASLTTPLIAACADATTGNNSANPKTNPILPMLSTIPSVSRPGQKCRRGSWRLPMVSGLLVGVGQLDHRCLAVRSAEEGNPHRQAFRCKSRRHRNRRDRTQECAQMSRAFHVRVGRIGVVPDQGRRMLDGLVNNGVQFVVCHHLQGVDQQIILRDTIVSVVPVKAHRSLAASFRPVLSLLHCFIRGVRYLTEIPPDLFVAFLGRPAARSHA